MDGGSAEDVTDLEALLVERLVPVDVPHPRPGVVGEHLAVRRERSDGVGAAGERRHRLRGERLVRLDARCRHATAAAAARELVARDEHAVRGDVGVIKARLAALDPRCVSVAAWMPATAAAAASATAMQTE